MEKTPIERTTREAWVRAAAGVRPDTAWKQALEAVYPATMLRAQLQHTCPKWAFSILCHRGNVSKVAAGCCVDAEGMRSATFAEAAFNMLKQNRGLKNDKRRLKDAVFGAPDSPTYRKPNHEVEVILALLELGALDLDEQPVST